MKISRIILACLFSSISLVGMVPKVPNEKTEEETVPLDSSYVVSKTLVEMIAARNLSTYVDTSFEEKKRVVHDYIKKNKKNPNNVLPKSVLFPEFVAPDKENFLRILFKDIYRIFKGAKKPEPDIESLLGFNMDKLSFILESANYFDIPLLQEASVNIAAKHLSLPLQLDTFLNDPKFWAYHVNPDIGKLIAQKIILNNPESVNDIEIPCIKVFKGHRASVTEVCFSPDSQHIISGSRDGAIKIWNLKSGTCIKTLERNLFKVESESISADGSLLASGLSDGAIEVWNLKSGTRIKTLNGHNDLVHSVNLSPTGNYIASGGTDNTIKIWDLKSGKCIKAFNGHNDLVHSVVLSPNGNYIASGGMDSTIKIWDLKSGECIKTLRADGCILSLGFSPDGKNIVSGSTNSTQIWDLKSGECIKTFESHNVTLTSVFISPNGKHLVSGSRYDTIKIWDLKSGKCIKTLSGHVSYLSSVQLSPNGKYMVSGYKDSTIKIWDMHNFNVFQSLTLPQILFWMATKKLSNNKAPFEAKKFLNDYQSHLLKLKTQNKC